MSRIQISNWFISNMQPYQWTDSAESVLFPSWSKRTVWDALIIQLHLHATVMTKRITRREWKPSNWNDGSKGLCASCILGSLHSPFTGEQLDVRKAVTEIQKSWQFLHEVYVKRAEFYQLQSPKNVTPVISSIRSREISSLWMKPKYRWIRMWSLCQRMVIMNSARGRIQAEFRETYVKTGVTKVWVESVSQL